MPKETNSVPECINSEGHSWTGVRQEGDKFVVQCNDCGHEKVADHT